MYSKPNSAKHPPLTASERPAYRWSGSCEYRGDVAAGAAIRLGATPLEAAIVGEVASRGVNNWQTDRTLASLIVKRHGGNYHPRSVARSRRALTLRGILRTKRIAPREFPHGAWFRSAYGTTDKLVDFRALGERDPLSARDKRRIGRRLQVIERHQAHEHQSEPRPRFVSAVLSEVEQSPSPAGSARLDSELEAITREIEQRYERRWQAEERAQDDAMLAAIPCRAVGPPR